MLSRHGIADGPEDDLAYSKATLPSVPFLPQQITSEQTGLVLNVRNMKPHEDRIAYQLVKASMERGEGYTQNQFVSLAAFRRFRLLSRTCLVITEDASNGAIVATAMFGPTWHSRSPTAGYGESAAIFDKKYQVYI